MFIHERQDWPLFYWSQEKIIHLLAAVRHRQGRLIGRMESLINLSFNDRQRIILNKLLEGFEGKLTSSKWAKLTRCSQDTALRDIQDLVERNVLKKELSGGRSTSYCLIERGEPTDAFLR